MNVIYIKYANNKRNSIIKDGKNILNIDSKISTTKYCKTLESENDSFASNLNSQTNSSTIAPVINLQKHLSASEKRKNDEITNFFFNAVHKNYLKNKK